jgi:hypothetical protein
MAKGPSTDLTPEEIAAIAVDGYIYLYPLITMELTRRQLTSGAADAQAGRGPMGMFHHFREFPEADFKVVVRPNFDTLYSTAWLDVSTEPVIVTAPDAGDRYYLLPCYDMWSDAFVVPGTRTTGSGPLTFALAPPQWRGTLPEGVARYDVPTPVVWIIGRTQTNGPADYDAVHAFQDQLTATPLSCWGGTAPEPTVVDNPAWDTTTPPLDLVNGLSGADYFELGASLMVTHPPHLTDGSLLARMARIGFTPGRPFRAEDLDATVATALEGVPGAAQAAMAAAFPSLAPVVNGWMNITDTMGVYGNFYVKRAVVTMVGLGANPQEDAVYPILETDADGQPLDGSNDYVIHFDAGALPPAEAFWSVTMYDAQGFQAANELDRFAIGDRDPLVANPDGSLDILIQHGNPGPDKVANWLPAPVGPLGITMRLYWPSADVLSGAWTPPAVRKVG